MIHINLWNWGNSNGAASAEQTKTAYDTLTNKGLTANFSYLVWNDLVKTLVSILSSIGKEWTASYASAEDTLMSAENKNLTSTRFNAVVSNLQYPYPYWLNQKDRNGYLGRAFVHGLAEYGKNADIVYGEYLLELAHILNVLIDAEEELGAGYATLLASTKEASLSQEDILLLDRVSGLLSISDNLSPSNESLFLMAPLSQHLAADLKSGSKDDAALIAAGSGILKAGGCETVSEADVALTANLSTTLDVDNKVRVIRSISLIAQRERYLLVEYGIRSGSDTVLSTDKPTLLVVTRDIPSATDVDLGVAQVLPLLSEIVNRIMTDAVLSPDPSTVMEAAIKSVLGIDAELSPDPSALLEVTEDSATKTRPDIALLDDPSDIMDAEGKHGSDGSYELRDPLSAPGEHTAKLNLGQTSFILLRAPSSRRMGHKYEFAGGSTFTGAMLALASRVMEHEYKFTGGTSFEGAMRAPEARIMEYEHDIIMRAALQAAMRAAEARRMEYKSEDAIHAVSDLTLLDAVAARLELDGEASVHLTDDMTMRSAASALLEAEVDESLAETLDGTLVAIPVTLLEGFEITSSSNGGGELATVPPTVLPHKGHIGGAEASAELAACDGVREVVNGVIVTAMAAVLEAKPTVEPATDWATQEGTNLDIRRTYYNRKDETDGSVLVIDQAWYQEPVQDGANLAITSEGYNDYGLEATHENKV